ncbi:pyridoxamine 5'-phosphate oxidase-related FMN- binding protein [Kribbella flavida DSM 17836]|uniref:Pyridoxamine 5'-phosphate oxidase-related FMN-binding protein n=1 Tax=Kribbella flavida (strain DSM 17836 / JCM 10339 / NBRC 14399) TaxID=479435 RepID=D2PY71_KRIFD|nr:TIGR03668 family PPOX class F420-dependent oxidoreductase [Kribbella flavida]ADB35439.1 pyridoxamine 5'-phosphate oxidase-related FMN- binding protein [Kribbella flavida DSM 17836]
MILPTRICRARFAAADRAVLATTGSDLRPHLVPVTFTLTDDVVVVAVDHKPKTTRNLRRLRNLTENPKATLLVDHYSPDWTHLWWIRADCTAAVVPTHPTDGLAAKYPQYAETSPAGPFIVAHVDHWTGWSAS